MLTSNGEVPLHEISLSNKQDSKLTAPFLKNENVPIYLEVNPLKECEMMMVTSKNDFYISQGQEGKWNKILSNEETE